MLSLTTEAKQAWLAQTRQVSARITIGTTVYNADKIMSVEYDSGSISGETFQIGSFYQNSIKVVLVGILESLANDDKVKLEFAVKVGSSFVWTNMGNFYVSELDRDRNSNRTTFTAVDGSVYLGSTYNPTITFPNSLKNLVTDIANQCGVQVNFASMTHLADVSVVQPPSKYTCRQVISMVAQIHGGFARMNRNDELEVTRLMSADLELNPSQYLLKGLVKNETTYRTDGIIVKTGDNDTDKIQVGTATGSAVISLENPLMTQQLLDTMWQTVSTISYYPFTLKWRGIPNLEAGDWITVVDKQGTRFRVPNLSYKLSFKGGLSATSSANTTATSNVQHRLRGTLTQRVEDVEGYVNATGGRSYAGLDVPDSKYLKKGDTWYKPDGDDTAILVYDGTQWQEVASPEVFRQLQADLDALDQQAQEAFDKVDVLVQESPETKRLAQEAQNAVNFANQEIARLQTSVTDTKNDLASAEQEFANSLETTTRELTAKISGIDVGGRNLLRNTKDEYTVSISNLSSRAEGRQFDIEPTKNGEQYVLSFEAKASENGYVMQNHWYWGGHSGSQNPVIKAVDQDGNVQVNVPDTDGPTYITLTTEYKRYYIVFDVKDSVGKTRIVVGRLNDRIKLSNTGWVKIKEFKLEKGNIPTDWSPAPEDFQSDLSNTSIELSTKITESAAALRTEMSEKYSTKDDLTTLQGDYNSFKQQTAQGFSQQASSIQTIQTDTTNAKQLANDALSKANNAVTSATNASSTASSALTKAADATSVANSASQNATNAVASANTAVSTANTAKSNADKAIADVASLTQTVTTQSTRIDQTSSRIEQVASGVTEIGGRIDNLSIGSDNLIVNGGFPSNVSGWWNTPGIEFGVATHVFYYNGNKNIFVINSTSQSEGLVGSTRFKVKRNTDYTISFVGFSASNVKDTDVYFLGRHNDETSDWTTNKTIFANLKMSPSTATTYKATFNTGDSDEGYIRFDHNGSTDGQVASMFFGEIMLVEGTVAKKYQPSSADTQSQIDGITNNLVNNYYQKTTVDSKLSTAVSGITAQYTQDITTRLNNYYDKSTIDSKLTIDGTGITSYVKSTQSQLDGLRIGGRNLLYNTGYFDTSQLSGIVGDSSKINLYTTTINDNTSPSGKAYRVNKYRNGTENVRGGCYWRVPKKLIPGNKYTWSVYVKGVGVVDGLGQEQNGVKSVTLNDTWTKISHTFTANDNLNYQFTFYSISEFNLYFTNLMLEEGNAPTSWSPAPEDMATLTQYTQVKQQADQLSATVYDSASGLVTKTTQLAGKYAITNLNSYGDVLSSLNLNGGNVRIKGGLIDLDGNVRIQDAFVTNLKANSILAEEITAKATTVVNARISNLDAGVITTGILKGTNLSLNLGTGDVQFKKGRIQAPNNTLDIQVDTGIMKVLNTNGEGVTFQNGNLYFSNATEQSYFGSLIYNNQLFSNSFKGVSLIGKNAFQIKTSDYKDLSLSFATPQIGAGISASSNGMVLQSDKRVNIVGGQPSGELTTPAMISVGTAHGSYSSNGNGVTIDGYSDGIYLSVANGGKISMFGDVEFISGTITGPIVNSTDFSVKNMTFVFSTDGSYIKVETSFGTFKIPVSS